MRGTLRGAARGDRGGATVFTAACVAVLLLVGSALAVVTAALVGHRKAQAAADLAALAAASARAEGSDGCSAGAAIAEANDVRQIACTSAGEVVTVKVSVPGPDWLAWSADLTARARAGPAGVLED